jgi:serine/threonine-protein kinase
MTEKPQVQRLLDEILESDRTPEEVCGNCPELLPEVRKRWAQMRAVEAQLDALFPTSGGDKEVDTGVPWTDSVLPRVPGYDVEGVLGRGGMGAVYKARHLRLNRVVALKMLLAGAYATPHERARFQREAEAVAGLRHPNIVQLYDVADHEGRPYFTMEFVEGGSLAQKLAGTPQPGRQAATLAATLAQAVQAAHRDGVVHRDLKPANVLLTADGTPKISDFGLARRLEGEAGATQTGVPLGTPSYMAPEQAAGNTHAIGPAVDVYALGAILYELLTGRPPFRAATAAETIRQVIYEEPALPSHLNAKVPRDLETICLKCLHKEPERRYGSAGALAEDLRRFEEGRPIQARRLGWVARFGRWVRRQPAAAGLVVTGLALLGLALGGTLWLQRQQAQQQAETARQEGRQVQAVEAVLEQAADLQKQGRWPAARAALEAAPSLLGDSAPPDLRERVRQASADAAMVSELEDSRLRLLEGRKNQEPAAPRGDQLYAEAFRKYGIPLNALEPADAAARIRNSAIRETLLAFLHDWLFHWASGAERRLTAVLDQADDDDWRRSFRKTLLAAYDSAKRKDLLRAREARVQPPVILATLAGVFLHSSEAEEAQALLRDAQQLHPEDFWINLKLAYFLQEKYPREALGYFRAAVASRPCSGQAHVMLGRALRGAGDLDGAGAAFRNAIALNPNRAGARDLAWALAAKGGLEEARSVWEKILEGSPADYEVWYGYAQLCAFLGKEQEYRRACNALLERFADHIEHWTVAERTGVACLLLPSAAEWTRAQVLVDRAVETGPKFPHPDNAYLQFVKGLAGYRRGLVERAVPLLEESAALVPNRPGPRLVLAMAQFKSGATTQARKNLAGAVRAYDWTEAHANHTTAWVSHVLRREAEAMILPNLPAYLRGEYEPQDNDERFALLGSCQFQGLYHRAARLYADAFAADPELADRLTTECRYRTAREEQPDYDRMAPLDTDCRYLAARCAALAACGRGKDGAQLGAAERTRWRKQARTWLLADLALWAKTLETNLPADHFLAKKMLTLWQVEPDLTGLREPKALGDLPASERKDCLALWDEVDAVLGRIASYQRVVALDPNHTDFRTLENRVLQHGRLEEARAAWQTALESNPVDHDAWFGYAELCLFLGDKNEYDRACRDLLARFGGTVSPYIAERTGRACLLMPATGEVLGRAVALVGRAAATSPAQAEWAYSWFQFAQGLAKYRQGQFDEAIFITRGEASRLYGPLPRLVLAMALHRTGKVTEARHALAAAVLSDNYNWRADQARDHDAWICHTLRREAEAMVIPNLPVFLDGKYEPQDNDERLALLGVCQFKNRTCTTARLYAAAFAAAPNLAEDLEAGHRYNAARVAAQAGAGRGEDAAGLGDAERRRWRLQARQWLRADLNAWGKAADSGAPARDRARKTLTQWCSNPDLAGLRDPAQLDKLSTDERKDCLALWDEVARLLR